MTTLTDQEMRDLNEWAPLLSYRITEDFKWLIHSPAKIKCLFTGNQKGKTAAAAMDEVLRILGRHPIPKCNIYPDSPVRTIRFASQTLPCDASGGEVSNTQYPEFKKWLPASLIKKDITIRKPVMVIKSPLGGKDIVIEFVSFNQEIQAMAGVQRANIWIDENCGQGFFEEQMPRLFAADGDIIMTYTPIPGSSGWEFDNLYERARKIYRTKSVRERIRERTGEIIPACETREDGEDIEIIMAATDDNPTLETRVIDDLFAMYDDPAVIDARRYGMFMQLSGKLFKDFSPSIHVLNHDRVFPEGLPVGWKFARGIDYHPQTPWACVWAAISPQDEIFIYDEYNPSPDRLVTNDIAKRIAEKSGDYRFDVNLIDPLAAQKQSNSGFTVVDDLNRLFLTLKRDGVGTGGYWQTWDTKNEKGRDEVRKRLKNAIMCGKPFNNEQIKDGRITTLPTIWIMSHCDESIESMKNWRWEERNSRDELLIKDEKNKPIQRWSHFCMAIECLLKHPQVYMARFRSEPAIKRESPRYFTARY